jgi:hypothetical protein
MQQFRTVALLFVWALLIASCGRNNPMENVENAPLEAPQSATMDMITNAILGSGTHRGWKMRELQPGLIRGKIVVNEKHTVEVDITYNEKDFSINYANSIDMNYKLRGGVPYIHPKYNRWVSILRDDIQDQMQHLQ